MPPPPVVNRPSRCPRKTVPSGATRAFGSLKRKPPPRSVEPPSRANASSRPPRPRKSPGWPPASVARSTTPPSSASVTSRSRKSSPAAVGWPTPTTGATVPSAATTNTPAEGPASASVARKATAPAALITGIIDVGRD